VKSWLPVWCVLLVVGTASASADAQVVVVGTKSPTTPMSRDQVAAAFMGKIAGVEPLDLAEGNPVREDFYARELGKSAAQLKAYWAKLSFTGKGTPPREYANSAEVKRALAGNPNAIGYIEKAAVDASVRVVFEGAKP
jgi:ABC-type phosphate transport system substrate-binding protein